MGVAIGVKNSSAKSLQELRVEFPVILDTLAKTRPTAVDLFWALDRMKRRFAELTSQSSDLAQIKRALVDEAKAVHLEKRATDEAIGRFGAEYMPQDGRVMTQCNAGAPGSCVGGQCVCSGRFCDLGRRCLPGGDCG